MSKQFMALAISFAFASGPVFAGDITGTVTYTGKVPTLKPIAMDADPACAAKHKAPVANEMLALGAGNTMGNVMVRVKSSASGTFTVPAKPGRYPFVCTFSGHFQAGMKGTLIVS